MSAKLFQNRIFLFIQKILSGLFIFLLVFGNFGNFFDIRILPKVPYADAAQVTIDADAQAVGASHLQSGSQTVFTDDQTGYKFYRDSNGSCVYRKTTNGGTSWSASTTVDAQTDCNQIQVWYDKWTPGSASSSIHIVTLDTGNDDIWYNRLDTNGDTLLLGSAPVSMLTGSGQGGTTLTASENFTSITRATNGTIYAVSNDGVGVSDSFIIECTVSCNVNTNWTETTPLPLDAANDQNILVPLTDGNVMIIQRDISANDMRSRIWDDGSGTWAGVWTTIDANATVNTVYDVGFAAAVSSTTPGTVYLAYLANVVALGTDDQVRTARFNGTSWATSSNATSTTARGITNVAIGIDSANDDVYVAYSARTTPATANTGNVFWRKATSSMVNWETQIGPLNTGTGDIYGVDMNLASDQRLHVSWFDADVADVDIYGDTIDDIFPGVHASTSGSQVTSTIASTTNVYVGGKFLLYNNYVRRSYDITGLTITESGTVDGSNGLSNIKLQYEMDTVAPYDCQSVSYDGSEGQFGSTDTNGFSGANGVSSFTGTTVTLSTTTAMCGYVVMDVLDAALSSSTIDIAIANPVNDITVTDSTAGPATSQNLTGTTHIFNDTPTLTHYHWRNDDGTQATATSKTSGSEDTALLALQQSSPVRLRLQVSNEGSTSTGPTQYRLEYGSTTGICASTSAWVDVGAAGGEFDMSNSIHMTDGGDTTNIALGLGGVTDENTTFLSPNGGLKDTSSQTGSINLSPTQFVELEYSIVASTTAAEGNTYCFRVTNAGTPLTTYSQYPRANIAADVLVTASGTQIATTNIPATDFYVGGAYVFTDNTGSHTITSITIRENGTVDGQTELDNIRLRYDLDTSIPYDCSSESYSGSETQFGSIDTDGFSSANGTSTFSGSVTIATTSTLCLYTVLDTTPSVQNGDTIDIIIESPSTNVVLSGGDSVSPGITRDITGSTTLQGAVLTQFHYHWRNDNGTEAAASSFTNSIEDTPATNVAQTTPIRLRIEVSNEGSVTSPSRAYTLEFGTKISTCSAVSSWTNVGDVGGAFDMFNSTNLTDGTDTTNIANAIGGVTDENTTFLTPNSAVKDTSATLASTTLTSSQFLEAEFSIQQTANAGFDTTYCFRLNTTQNVPLDTYSFYPELTTSPERDFEIQRNFVNITGTSTTLVAGVNYIAPSASTSAFIRIANTNMTGAGTTTLGGTQNADDVTAYILNPSNIMNSVTIARTTGATGNTRVYWEIIEFIGEVGSDNEMIVRSQTSLGYGNTATTATGTTVSGVTDNSDIVVFITGQENPNTGTTLYNTGLSTSAWSASSSRPVFRRNEGGSLSIVSYAVVEFKGINWIVQRSEHRYSSAGTTETEAITAVGSLSRTFIHAQKRVGPTLPGTDEFGHEVWLSSVGFVSYFLEPGATTPASQTSVAWIIENIQTTSGALEVTRPPQGASNGGVEPLTLSLSITKTLSDLTNTSIFGTSRSAGTGQLFPHPIAGLRIASTTNYEIWRSDTGGNLTFRVEIVEWPTAGLAIKQNYYRFYVDNNELDPLVPWPEGGVPLPENAGITQNDDPLGEGERVRLRMSLQVNNATFPEGTRSYRLQYAALVSSCSAIPESSWFTLGNTSSSTVWRGYNATGTTDGTNLSTDPPSVGALNLSVSDVAGTFEEQNDTEVNPFAALENEDIEYDWIVQQNGASSETFYCFRMINTDGATLDGYLQYPQIRTASFTPKTQDWRWFDDEDNLTPTTSLAAPNVAPINITNNQIAVLRITVKEIKNIARDNMRFKLQYSEYADFSTSTDVLATSSCLVSTSTWCYGNAAGADNAVIASTTLPDTDSCISGVGDGCGTYNESSVYRTGFRHENGAASEYSFSLQSKYPRVNTVYYFRLYDLVQNAPVETNVGESYPSLVTEGASLTFSLQGVASTTVVEGVTADVSTTAVTVPYGRLSINTDVEAAHRLIVTTNAPEGYQIYMTTASDLVNSSGDTIPPIVGTNASPNAWNTGCGAGAQGCFGYHAGDDTLEGLSTRFAAPDTYARFSTTTLDEVVYAGGPVENDTNDIVYKIKARSLQEAGQYTTNIRYIAVPVF